MRMFLNSVGLGIAVVVSIACDESSKPAVQGGKTPIVTVSGTDDATSSKTTEATGAPIAPAVKAVIVVPDTQYPAKQLPLPTSEKAAETGAAVNDPTLIAFRLLLESGVNAGRSGPAPFQMFIIPNPLAATASLPVRTVVKDAEAPVVSTSGRPLPTLK